MCLFNKSAKQLFFGSVIHLSVLLTLMLDHKTYKREDDLYEIDENFNIPVSLVVHHHHWALLLVNMYNQYHIAKREKLSVSIIKNNLITNNLHWLHPEASVHH